MREASAYLNLSISFLMKLHLPSGLRKALLACLAAVALPPATVPTTIASASGIAAVFLIASQRAAAEFSVPAGVDYGQATTWQADQGTTAKMTINGDKEVTLSSAAPAWSAQDNPRAILEYEAGGNDLNLKLNGTDGDITGYTYKKLGDFETIWFTGRGRHIINSSTNFSKSIGAIYVNGAQIVFDSNVTLSDLTTDFYIGESTAYEESHNVGDTGGAIRVGEAANVVTTGALHVEEDAVIRFDGGNLTFGSISGSHKLTLAVITGKGGSLTLTSGGSVGGLDMAAASRITLTSGTFTAGGISATEGASIVLHNGAKLDFSDITGKLTIDLNGFNSANEYDIFGNAQFDTWFNSHTTDWTNYLEFTGLGEGLSSSLITDDGDHKGWLKVGGVLDVQDLEITAGGHVSLSNNEIYKDLVVKGSTGDDNTGLSLGGHMATITGEVREEEGASFDLRVNGGGTLALEKGGVLDGTFFAYDQANIQLGTVSTGNVTLSVGELGGNGFNFSAAGSNEVTLKITGTGGEALGGVASNTGENTTKEQISSTIGEHVTLELADSAAQKLSGVRVQGKVKLGADSNLTSGWVKWGSKHNILEGGLEGSGTLAVNNSTLHIEKTAIVGYTGKLDIQETGVLDLQTSFESGTISLATGSTIQLSSGTLKTTTLELGENAATLEMALTGSATRLSFNTVNQSGEGKLTVKLIGWDQVKVSGYQLFASDDDQWSTLWLEIEDRWRDIFEFQDANGTQLSEVELGVDGRLVVPESPFTWGGEGAGVTLGDNVSGDGWSPATGEMDDTKTVVTLEGSATDVTVTVDGGDDNEVAMKSLTVGNDGGSATTYTFSAASDQTLKVSAGMTINDSSVFSKHVAVDAAGSTVAVNGGTTTFERGSSLTAGKLTISGQGTVVELHSGAGSVNVQGTLSNDVNGSNVVVGVNGDGGVEIGDGATLKLTSNVFSNLAYAKGLGTVDIAIGGAQTGEWNNWFGYLFPAVAYDGAELTLRLSNSTNLTLNGNLGDRMQNAKKVDIEDGSSVIVTTKGSGGQDLFNVGTGHELRIEGSGDGGAGALVIGQAETISWAFVLDGDATVANTAAMTLTGELDTGSDGKTLTKKGDGTLEFGANFSTKEGSSGTVAVEEGTLKLSNTTNANALQNHTIALASGSTLESGITGTVKALTGTGRLNVTEGELTLTDTTGSTLTSLHLAAGAELTVSKGDFAITDALTWGEGSVLKLGEKLTINLTGVTSLTALEGEHKLKIDLARGALDQNNSYQLFRGWQKGWNADLFEFTMGGEGIDESVYTDLKVGEDGKLTWTDSFTWDGDSNQVTLGGPVTGDSGWSGSGDVNDSKSVTLEGKDQAEVNVTVSGGDSGEVDMKSLTIGKSDGTTTYSFSASGESNQTLKVTDNITIKESTRFGDTVNVEAGGSVAVEGGSTTFGNGSLTAGKLTVRGDGTVVKLGETSVDVKGGLEVDSESGAVTGTGGITINTGATLRMTQQGSLTREAFVDGDGTLEVAFGRSSEAGEDNWFGYLFPAVEYKPQEDATHAGVANVKITNGTQLTVAGNLGNRVQNISNLYVAENSSVTVSDADEGNLFAEGEGHTLYLAGSGQDREGALQFGGTTTHIVAWGVSLDGGDATISNAADVMLTGQLDTASRTLTKKGNGVLELAGGFSTKGASASLARAVARDFSTSANGDSGTIAVEKGTLKLSYTENADALAGHTIQLSSGATLESGITGRRVGTLAGTGDLRLSGGTLTIGLAEGVQLQNLVMAGGGLIVSEGSFSIDGEWSWSQGAVLTLGTKGQKITLGENLVVSGEGGNKLTINLASDYLSDERSGQVKFFAGDWDAKWADYFTFNVIGADEKEYKDVQFGSGGELIWGTEDSFTGITYYRTVPNVDGQDPLSGNTSIEVANDVATLRLEGEVNLRFIGTAAANEEYRLNTENLFDPHTAFDLSKAKTVYFTGEGIFVEGGNFGNEDASPETIYVKGAQLKFRADEGSTVIRSNFVIGTSTAGREDDSVSVLGEAALSFGRPVETRGRLELREDAKITFFGAGIFTVDGALAGEGRELALAGGEGGGDLGLTLKAGGKLASLTGDENVTVRLSGGNLELTQGSMLGGKLVGDGQAKLSVGDASNGGGVFSIGSLEGTLSSLTLYEGAEVSIGNTSGATLSTLALGNNAKVTIEELGDGNITLTGELSWGEGAKLGIGRSLTINLEDGVSFTENGEEGSLLTIDLSSSVLEEMGAGGWQLFEGWKESWDEYIQFQIDGKAPTGKYSDLQLNEQGQLVWDQGVHNAYFPDLKYTDNPDEITGSETMPVEIPAGNQRFTVRLTNPETLQFSFNEVERAPDGSNNLWIEFGEGCAETTLGSARIGVRTIVLSGASTVVNFSSSSTLDGVEDLVVDGGVHFTIDSEKIDPDAEINMEETRFWLNTGDWEKDADDNYSLSISGESVTVGYLEVGLDSDLGTGARVKLSHGSSLTVEEVGGTNLVISGDSESESSMLIKEGGVLSGALVVQSRLNLNLQRGTFQVNEIKGEALTSLTLGNQEGDPIALHFKTGTLRASSLILVSNATVQLETGGMLDLGHINFGGEDQEAYSLTIRLLGWDGIGDYQLFDGESELWSQYRERILGQLDNFVFFKGEEENPIEKVDLTPDGKLVILNTVGDYDWTSSGNEVTLSDRLERDAGWSTTGNVDSTKTVALLGVSTGKVDVTVDGGEDNLVAVKALIVGKEGDAEISYNFKVSASGEDQILAIGLTGGTEGVDGTEGMEERMTIYASSTFGERVAVYATTGLAVAVKGGTTTFESGSSLTAGKLTITGSGTTVILRAVGGSVNVRGRLEDRTNGDQLIGVEGEGGIEIDEGATLRLESADAFGSQAYAKGQGTVDVAIGGDEAVTGEWNNWFGYLFPAVDYEGAELTLQLSNGTDLSLRSELGDRLQNVQRVIVTPGSSVIVTDAGGLFTVGEEHELHIAGDGGDEASAALQFNGAQTISWAFVLDDDASVSNAAAMKLSGEFNGGSGENVYTLTKKGKGEMELDLGFSTKEGSSGTIYVAEGSLSLNCGAGALGAYTVRLGAGNTVVSNVEGMLSLGTFEVVGGDRATLKMLSKENDFSSGSGLLSFGNLSLDDGSFLAIQLVYFDNEWINKYKDGFQLFDPQNIDWLPSVSDRGITFEDGEGQSLMDRVILGQDGRLTWAAPLPKEGEGLYWGGAEYAGNTVTLGDDGNVVWSDESGGQANLSWESDPPDNLKHVVLEAESGDIEVTIASGGAAMKNLTVGRVGAATTYTFKGTAESDQTMSLTEGMTILSNSVFDGVAVEVGSEADGKAIDVKDGTTIFERGSSLTAGKLTVRGSATKVILRGDEGSVDVRGKLDFQRDSSGAVVGVTGEGGIEVGLGATLRLESNAFGTNTTRFAYVQGKGTVEIAIGGDLTGDANNWFGYLFPEVDYREDKVTLKLVGDTSLSLRSALGNRLQNAQNVVVASGSSVIATDDGGLFTVGEGHELHIAGTGRDEAGALQSNGAQTISWAFVLDDSATVSNAAAMTLFGEFNGGGHTLTKKGAGVLELADGFSTKKESRGTISVAEGTLKLSYAANVGELTGDEAPEYLENYTVQLAEGTTLESAAPDEIVVQRLSGEGSVLVESGQLTVGSAEGQFNQLTLSTDARVRVNEGTLKAATLNLSGTTGTGLIVNMEGGAKLDFGGIRLGADGRLVIELVGYSEEGGYNEDGYHLFEESTFGDVWSDLLANGKRWEDIFIITGEGLDDKMLTLDSEGLLSVGSGGMEWQGGSTWSDASGEEWEGGESPDGKDVLFTELGSEGGRGNVEIDGTVTPSNVNVRGGSYTFVQNKDSEGGLDIGGELRVGGSSDDASLTLKLKNTRIPEITLMDRGTLVLAHDEALTQETTIRFRGGVLAFSEVSLENPDVSSYVARGGDGGSSKALKVSVDSVAYKGGVTWGNADTSVEGNGGLSLALNDEGIEKGGDGDFTLEWREENNAEHSGAITVVGGKLIYKVHTGEGAAVKLSGDANVESSQLDLTVDGSGTVEYSGKIMGNGTVALGSSGGKVKMSGDNSGFAGTISVNEGTIEVGNDKNAQDGEASGALGGENTTLVLNGGNLSGSKVVKAGKVNVNSDATLSGVTLAGKVKGSSSLTAGNNTIAGLSGDIQEYSGELKTGNSGTWKLVDGALAGQGGVVSNTVSGNGTVRFLGAAVYDGEVLGNVTLEGAGSDGAQLVIISDKKTEARAKLKGQVTLGNSEKQAKWLGNTLVSGNITLANVELASGGITNKADAKLYVNTAATAQEDGGMAASGTRSESLGATVVNVNGMRAENLDGITINEHGQLTGITGNYTADGAHQLELHFAAENVGGSSTVGEEEKALVVVGEDPNFALSAADKEDVGLWLSFDAVMGVIHKMRPESEDADGEEAVGDGLRDVYLHLLQGEGAQLTIGDGTLSINDLKGDSAQLLEMLDIEEVAVDGGSIRVTGSVGNVFVAPSGSSTLTDASALSEMDAVVLADSTDELTLDLDGKVGGATLNNLLGVDGSQLHLQNSDREDPTGANRLEVTFRNAKVSIKDEDKHPVEEPDLGETTVEGQHTTFNGTIDGGEGVDVKKTGLGTLSVGGDFTLGDGTTTITAGALKLRGAKNSFNNLVFDYANEQQQIDKGEDNRGLLLKGGRTTVGGSISEGALKKGDIVLSEGAELMLDGESNLEGTAITGDGSAKLTLTGRDDRGASLMLSGGENVALGEDGKRTVLSGVDVELREGSSLGVSGSEAAIKDSDLTLEKGAKLTLTDGATITGSSATMNNSLASIDLGSSAQNSLTALNGNGTLMSDECGNTTITGEAGPSVFSGKFANSNDSRGAGKLTVAKGADVTLDNVDTSAAGGSTTKAWDVEVQDGGRLTLDVSKSKAGEKVVLGDVSFGTNNTVNLKVNSSDYNADDASTIEGNSLTFGDNTTVVLDASSGEIWDGSNKKLTLGHWGVINGSASDIDVQLTGAGFFLAEVKGIQIVKESTVEIQLEDAKDNKFERAIPNGEKNTMAGASMVWESLKYKSSVESLADVLSNSDSDYALMVHSLITQLDGGQMESLKNALAAVAGSSVATIGPAVMEDLHRQLKSIRNRTTTMASDATYDHYDRLPLWHAWINGEGGYHKMDADSLMPGYTLNNWGGTVGVDVDMTPRSTIGLAITAMYGNLKPESVDAATGNVDTTYLSGFVRGTSGAWIHTFVMSGGKADVQLDRTVNYGSGSYRTRGSTDGYVLGAVYEVGYTKLVSPRGTFALQPVFNVEARHASIKGYTESGSDAGLHVDDISQDVITFGLGARMQSIVGENAFNRTAIFETRMLLKADAGDRSGSVNNTLLGSASSSEVESAEVGAVGVEVGAGLTIPLGASSGSIFMDASMEWRKGWTSVDASVGYRINF